MPIGNLLGIRDSVTMSEIDWIPVIVSKTADKGELVIPHTEAMEFSQPRFDSIFRRQIERLLTEGYKVPKYTPDYDYWALRGYWLTTNTFGVHIAFGPGDTGSHFYALPQLAWYPWEKTAFLARVTLWKGRVNYGFREYATPEQALEFLRGLIED